MAKYAMEFDEGFGLGHRLAFLSHLHGLGYVSKVEFGEDLRYGVMSADRVFSDKMHDYIASMPGVEDVVRIEDGKEKPAALVPNKSPSRVVLIEL